MSELPLLEGCPPEDLPPTVRVWIDPHQALPFNVSHYRAHRPVPAIFHGLAAAGLAGVGLLMWVTMGIRLVMGSLTMGHGVVFLVFAPLFTLAAGFMSWRAVRAFRLRQAHRQDRIRTGYFVSETAFLDFDGSRAWLVPRRLVQQVRNRSTPHRGGSEHALLYRRDEQIVHRPLAGDFSLPRDLEFWHSQHQLPSGVGWKQGTRSSPVAAAQAFVPADEDMHAAAQRLRDQAVARAEAQIASESPRPPPLDSE